MSDDLHAEAYRELQREYLAELPTAIAELRTNIEAFAPRRGRGRRAPAPDSTGSPARAARTVFPRSARSRGRRSNRSRARLQRRGRTGSTRRFDASRRRSPSRERRLAAGTEVARTGLRAVLVLPAGAERDRVTEALVGAGFAVDLRGRTEDPLTVTGDQRVDLLVIGTAAGRGRPFRRRLLVDQPPLHPAARGDADRDARAVDRLRAVAAGVDAVFPAERMVADLPRYARTLAQSRPAAFHRAPARRRCGSLPAGWSAYWSRRTSGWCAVHSARPRESCWTARCPDLLATAPRLADGDGFSVLRTCARTRDSTCCRSSGDRTSRPGRRRSRPSGPAPTTSCPTPLRPGASAADR